ncbi:hypothetical protein APHAL10511_005101 [Amanita phalloides]|nr:hypothetical protein APHAL10511_005101 [Amanita phalloides]
MSSRRTRSRRIQKATGPEAHEPTFGLFGHPEAGVPPTTFEPPWDRKMFASSGHDSLLVVDYMVKALLNELTMEKFDSTSDQIIQWANRTENQTDGRTLIQVTRLVYEKAVGIDDAAWSEMYARLCRKMMEQIGPGVRDEGIKNSDGRPISGGQLIRKYLLNRCQEDFERSWVAKEAASGDEVAPCVQKAKCQYPGLIRFLGDLFKLQMLTERIMHGCIKILLGGRNPEEDEIEGLCKMMTAIGAILDTKKAHAHMDVYFQRMKELTQSSNDVLELRGRKWIARNSTATPATLAQIREAVAKEKASQEKESSQQSSMPRGSSRRGGNRKDCPQADKGAAMGTTSRATTRTGDLSQFGRIRNTQPVTTFIPSSVFAGKKDAKQDPTSRTNHGSSMFALLENPEAAWGGKEPPQRKKLMLQPHTKPLKGPTRPVEESVIPSEEEAPTPAMTERAADARITEDVKEFFNVRSLDEAEVYFITLSSQHHHRLVNKLVTSAVESKEPEAQLVASLFTRANSKGLCSPDAFEEGLAPTAETIEDIVIDAPRAWALFAIMVKGAKLDYEHRTRLASKSTDSDKLLGLLS